MGSGTWTHVDFSLRLLFHFISFSASELSWDMYRDDEKDAPPPATPRRRATSLAARPPARRQAGFPAGTGDRGCARTPQTRSSRIPPPSPGPSAPSSAPPAGFRKRGPRAPAHRPSRSSGVRAHGRGVGIPAVKGRSGGPCFHLRSRGGRGGRGETVQPSARE